MTTRKACIVLFILVNVVIFYFSAQTGEVSNAVSDSFSHVVKVEKVAPLFNTPSWELWHLKLALRKYAHVFLFGLLGVFGFLAWNLNKRLCLRIALTVIIYYAMAYKSFCKNIGQALDWKGFSKAAVVFAHSLNGAR